MSSEKGTVLAGCLGTGKNLTELVDYAADSIVSKTILDKPAGTITLFAFDAGQKLSEHTTPYDAVVQVLDGQAKITIDGRENDVAAGGIIIMPGNVPHAVDATKRFKMLLTMIRTKV
ncbi:MAG: cupin domain-containing protein [Sedimentisphaerales bacterium]|nr:cupin domain-containing protein [Sedimentisphaerales bacterium]